MAFRHVLKNGIEIVSSRPEHAKGLEQLQVTVFPTLADEERFKEHHYRKHIELFPEGQFCALGNGRIVGMTSTIRLHFDFDHIDHTFSEIIAGGYMTTHEPDGEWLYGADVGTHPDYRGKGIGRALYAARHAAVRALGMKGQVTAGMPSGYGALKDRMSAQEYYDKVVAGELTDPTVSMQMHMGFEPRGLIADYLDDPVCDNYGVLLVLPSKTDVPFEK